MADGIISQDKKQVVLDMNTERGQYLSQILVWRETDPVLTSKVQNLVNRELADYPAEVKLEKALIILRMLYA